MPRITLTIATNGVTGRVGYDQRLVRSVLVIRADGGFALPGGTTIWPEHVLVGRGLDKLKIIAERHGPDRYATGLDEALDRAGIHFDAQLASPRPGSRAGDSTAPPPRVPSGTPTYRTARASSPSGSPFPATGCSGVGSARGVPRAAGAVPDVPELTL